MNALRRMLLVASVALVTATAYALEQPGTTAAPVLQIPLGARAVGMGTAYTAVTDDIYSLNYNPAGLATLGHREATFTYLKGLDDQNVEYFGFGSPIPFHGVIGNEHSSVAASLLFSQNGTIQINRTGADGSFLDSRTVSAGGDLVASLSYAEQVADTPIESPQTPAHIHHFMGISGKGIHSTLADKYSASAVAADIGYLMRCPEMGWSAGASILNAGTRMRFVSEGDPLPMTLRGGGAYQITAPGMHEITLAADGDYLYYERQWHVNAGVEYLALKQYAVRMGYQFHRDVAGFSMGFGYRWDNFQMDYSWALSAAVTDTHRFSLTYRFGPVPNREPEMTSRSYMESLQDQAEFRDIEQEKPKTPDRLPKPRRDSVPDAVPGWIY